MAETQSIRVSQKSSVAAIGAPTIVLSLLCRMYFITYLDRVNIATAATAIQAEFGLTKTDLGLVLGIFGYAYALLQIMGGLMRPTSGGVFLDGKPVTVPPFEVIYLFQQYTKSLYPWRTVLGNVQLGMQYRGVPRAAALA